MRDIHVLSCRTANATSVYIVFSLFFLQYVGWFGLGLGLGWFDLFFLAWFGWFVWLAMAWYHLGIKSENRSSQHIMESYTSK